MPLSYATWPDGNQAYNVWVVLAGIVVSFAAGAAVGLRFGRAGASASSAPSNTASG